MRPDVRLGTELGTYRIDAVLGRGGMGVVYRAEHLRLKRRVALKLLAPELADEEGFRARFLRESELAAAIDHPNVIPIYEAGEADGEFFLAMRFVDGVDLASKLKEGPLDVDDTLTILSQAAGALDAAHRAGLVHRDVKPGNILIVPGGSADGSDHIYLTDFGLTKRRDSRSGLTQAGSFLGSLDYIAPEQIEGRDVDGRADLYALGCMLYHCLTASTPFPRDNDVAVINAHLRDTPPSVRDVRPELPVAIDRVVRKAMAKKPDDRYPTGRAFIGALKEALGRTPTETRPIPVSPLRRRLPMLGAAAVVGLAAMLALAAASFGLLGGSPTASPTGLAAATATIAPTPTSTAFPNAEEQALLARLPASITEECERTEPLESGVTSLSIPYRSTAAVVCTVRDGAKTITATIFSFPFAGQPAQVFFEAVGRLRLPAGDCATMPRAYGKWGAGGLSGDLACFQGGDPEQSRLSWTHNAQRLYARAASPDVEPAALYDWWLTVAPFVD